jgi:glycosyl transferase family 25
MLQNKDQLALIFENDPFFINHFEERIAAIVAEAKQLDAGFIVSMENTTLKYPSRKLLQKGKYLYPAQFGRCAGAYLIDQTAVRNIMEDLKVKKCAQVIDWWHNDMIKRGVVRMYWAHPPVIEQGSHNGKMHSTISSKAQNWVRRIGWISQKYYKTYFLRLFR